MNSPSKDGHLASFTLLCSHLCMITASSPWSLSDPQALWPQSLLSPCTGLPLPGVENKGMLLPRLAACGLWLRGFSPLNPWPPLVGSVGPLGALPHLPFSSPCKTASEFFRDRQSPGCCQPWIQMACNQASFGASTACQCSI
jgi:hypothetical protein